MECRPVVKSHQHNAAANAPKPDIPSDLAWLSVKLVTYPQKKRTKTLNKRVYSVRLRDRRNELLTS